MDKITHLLKKVIPIILDDPQIIFGYDISREEVEYVEINKKIPIQYLENLGGDNFFLNTFEKFNIKKEDAIILDKYLYSKAYKDSEYLKKNFSCIVDHE